MKRVTWTLALVAAGAIVVSCGGDGGEATGESEAEASLYAETARAAAAATTMKTELKGALQAAMQEGGPPHAISVCRTDAPAVAARLSVDGLRVGRTSHRVRNPGNAPAPWLDPLLSAYLENPGKRDPRTVDLGDGTVGYVEPLYAEAVCLSCHGSQIAPEIASELAQNYPEDQAVGFAEGDLRGLLWVIVPKEGAE
jgi:hypothetical protein